MSLEGYLEDLGITDILQILSLSKKSGTLALANEREKGSITFLEGQVVRATSTEAPETLGHLLRQHQLVSEAQVNQALTLQKKAEIHQPLGEILSHEFGISTTYIEDVVKQQIEKIVFRFFTWTAGTFEFQLGQPESFGSTFVNPLDIMLEQGISSQQLVLKGQEILAQGRPNLESAGEQDPGFDQEVADDQGLGLLRGMLAELEDPAVGGGIILLILRYASEIMGRAIIFDVRGTQLVGLGQFGLAGLSAAADEIVRKLRLTIENGSLFFRAIQKKATISSELGETTSESTLISLLGGSPTEVFLAPLVSDGKVVALLYGDNYPAETKIGSTNAFEIFLSRAGLAMEQALKERA